MLLGRTANGLYWMNRYLERAENVARLLDAGMYMALTRVEGSGEDWSSILLSAGVESEFRQQHSDVNAGDVIDFMLREKSNSSSIISAMETARNNGRMVRTALTREAWEALNDAWMTMSRILKTPVDYRELPTVLNAIKRETALVRGVLQGTMLRNEIFSFLRMGTYVERADNTARILDVKYYVLLPSASWVGSSLDNQQWESILRSVSAHRSYRWCYDTQYNAADIVDFLVLNSMMPRSLSFCYRSIIEALDDLADTYGTRHGSHDRAQQIRNALKVNSIHDIFEQGLHEFLAGFINDNIAFSQEVAADYRFI
jgi:uncharacterized alpha-E superfamily protein